MPLRIKRFRFRSCLGKRNFAEKKTANLHHFVRPNSLTMSSLRINNLNYCPFTFKLVLSWQVEISLQMHYCKHLDMDRGHERCSPLSSCYSILTRLMISRSFLYFAPLNCLSMVSDAGCGIGRPTCPELSLSPMDCVRLFFQQKSQVRCDSTPSHGVVDILLI